MSKTISLSARATSIRLGLGDLVVHRPICHGYQCGCTCPECMREHNRILDHRAAGRNPFTPNGKIAPKPEPKQPWAA